MANGTGARTWGPKVARLTQSKAPTYVQYDRERNLIDPLISIVLFIVTLIGGICPSKLLQLGRLECIPDGLAKV